MTEKKPRKPLTDSLSAEEFVFGKQAQPKEEDPETITPTAPPPLPTTPSVNPTKPKNKLMQKLIAETPEKEATIRLTVDMPESLHRKLSLLCARTGKKKADVVRMLLLEALEDLDE